VELLHPPPLASDFVASYGALSRRSGNLCAVARSAEVDAAKADNHSDISPFESVPVDQAASHAPSVATRSRPST
jgi:hypothetical protein